MVSLSLIDTFFVCLFVCLWNKSFSFHHKLNILHSTGDQPGTDVGPLISPDAKKRVLHLIQTGVDEGASLVLDGRDVVVQGYEKGNFVGPTILTDVQVCSSGEKHVHLLVNRMTKKVKVVFLWR